MSTPGTGFDHQQGQPEPETIAAGTAEHEISSADEEPHTNVLSSTNRADTDTPSSSSETETSTSSDAEHNSPSTDEQEVEAEPLSDASNSSTEADPVNTQDTGKATS